MFTTFALIAVACALCYLFLSWNFDYWRKRGVIGPKPHILVGNFPNAVTQKEHTTYDVQKIYSAYKNDEDFVGVFSFRMPQLLILSPKLVREVLVNNFRNFHDNEISTWVDDKSDILFGSNIFCQTGEKWKERRLLVTPALTTSRIKAVYPITQQVCGRLKQYIQDQIRAAPKDGINAKDLSLRFTSEVVTDCVLGLQAASFSKNPTPIMGMIKKLFEVPFATILHLMLSSIVPVVRKVFKTRFVPKNAEIFFVDLIRRAVETRKSQQPQADRADLLSYLMQLQAKKNLSFVDLSTYTMTFLLDGFETTAAVLAHCLLFLGRHREVQERLREEILAHVDANGVVDFETLTELRYLDACIHETLRFFPPGFTINRLCTAPTTLQNKSGHSVHIEKGTIVVLPIHSLMMDEHFYPNSQAFQPDRFIPPNGCDVKEYREKGQYYGFSDGPRVCIGMRFALTQMKAALVDIVLNFNVHINNKTRRDNVFDPKAFFPHLDGGVWLDFEAKT